MNFNSQSKTIRWLGFEIEEIVNCIITPPSRRKTNSPKFFPGYTKSIKFGVNCALSENWFPVSQTSQLGWPFEVEKTPYTAGLYSHFITSFFVKPDMAKVTKVLSCLVSQKVDRFYE